MRNACAPSSGLRPSMDWITSPSSSLNTLVLRRLHHQHAFVGAEVRAELRCEARELHAAELAGEESAGVLEHGHGTPAAKAAHVRAHLRRPHGEYLPVEGHRPRHHDEILVLAVAQARAPSLSDRALRSRICSTSACVRVAAAGEGFAIERDDDIAVAQSGLRGRTTRAHVHHARAGLVAGIVDLHAEAGAAIADRLVANFVRRRPSHRARAAPTAPRLPAPPCRDAHALHPSNTSLCLLLRWRCRLSHLAGDRAGRSPRRPTGSATTSRRPARRPGGGGAW